MSFDRNGSMVVRQCLDFCNFNQLTFLGEIDEKLKIFNLLIQISVDLAMDPFGNYVIQHLIKKENMINT